MLYPDRAPRPASVLIPIVVHADAACVLLTERTAHLHDHAGQISFPGGRVEKGDADAIATALREAHEEIGLPPADVDVIGTLPEYLTATAYRVTPVIGLVERPFTPVLDAFEVSEVFEVPLAFLMDPINHERRIFQLGDTGAHVLCNALRDTAARCGGSSLFHLGRHGRDSAQSVSVLPCAALR